MWYRCCFAAQQDFAVANASVQLAYVFDVFYASAFEEALCFQVVWPSMRASVRPSVHPYIS